MKISARMRENGRPEAARTRIRFRQGRRPLLGRDKEAPLSSPRKRRETRWATTGSHPSSPWRGPRPARPMCEGFRTPARKTKERAVSGMTDKNRFRPGYRPLLGGRVLHPSSLRPRPSRDPPLIPPWNGGRNESFLHFVGEVRWRSCWAVASFDSTSTKTRREKRAQHAVPLQESDSSRVTTNTQEGVG